MLTVLFVIQEWLHLGVSRHKNKIRNNNEAIYIRYHTLGPDCDPSVDPEYVSPGKLLWINWNVDIFHLPWPCVGCFTAPAGCAVRLQKTSAKNQFPVFQALGPAVRKTVCQDHISRIPLLLQVMMPVTCHLRTDCNRETAAEFLGRFLPRLVTVMLGLAR